VLYRAAPGNDFARLSTPPSAVGALVVFTTHAASGNTDVWAVDLGDSTTGRPLLNSPEKERGARISPDGELLAWVSEESGRPEVYLGRLTPDGGLQPRRWQVSSLGGEDPRWGPDGSRIYYTTETHLVEVTVDRRDGIALGRPRALFDLGERRLEPHHGYGLTPDGSGLVTTQVGGAEPEEREIVVVRNWYEPFRGR
jgi:dipeptidyl aminopeptidase/acylaminoacyl peptidase